MRGMAYSAGRLVLPVFVVVDHDLYQEHHACSRQSPAPKFWRNNFANFGVCRMLLKFNTHSTRNIRNLNFVSRRRCSFKEPRVASMVQNQVQKKHQYQNSAKGHHNRRARWSINLNTQNYA